jgi:hypothetical protein
LGSSLGTHVPPVLASTSLVSSLWFLSLTCQGHLGHKLGARFPRSKHARLARVLHKNTAMTESWERYAWKRGACHSLHATCPHSPSPSVLQQSTELLQQEVGNSNWNRNQQEASTLASIAFKEEKDVTI